MILVAITMLVSVLGVADTRTERAVGTVSTNAVTVRATSTNGVPLQVTADEKTADDEPGDKILCEDDEAISENLVKASRRIRGFLDKLGIKYKYKPLCAARVVQDGHA